MSKHLRAIGLIVEVGATAGLLSAAFTAPTNTEGLRQLLFWLVLMCIGAALLLLAERLDR